MAKSDREQDSVTPSAEGLAATARRAGARGPAPVHLWNPPFCGDLDIRIARDGTWFYLGTPIGRPGLVRLFASILKREGDRFFLVTPVEKVGITVEDAPFVAVDVERAGGDLVFTTNLGDRVTAGPGHSVRVTPAPGTGEPAPCVHVRAGLDARIDRKTFLRLADMGEHRDHHGARWFGLASGGVFFPIVPSAELDP
jgi:uncharacterized protein